MEELCTLEQAKSVLGVFDDSQDTEIQEAIVTCSAVILDYCQLNTTADVEALTDRQKECTRAATLMLIPVYYDGTGEKTPDYDIANGELPRAVTMFLGRIKRNSIA